MRKELKSKSRRKWLLGGSLAFASVALLTTGFATWVIGTKKTSGDGQLNIDVDTAEDNSVELTFSLDTDNTIFVAEPAGETNHNLTIKRKTGTDREPDWNITIKDLKIVVGQTFYESLKGKDLKIAFELQKDVTEAENKNLVTKDEVGVRTGSSWNYIELAKSKFDVTLPPSYPEGGKIYDINDTPNNPNKTFSFTWGSYFDEKAPSVFYQEKEESRGSQTLREYYQNALKELKAMNTALNGGELKLTATFNYMDKQ